MIILWFAQPSLWLCRTGARQVSDLPYTPAQILGSSTPRQFIRVEDPEAEGRFFGKSETGRAPERPSHKSAATKR